MKKGNKIIISILFLLIVMIPTYGFAESKSVTVTLPDFSIKINGYQVNNAFSEYPLIRYNNTTYMPMTYYNSRFLGIETEWNDSYEKYFKINKTAVTAGYKNTITKKKNKKVDTANFSTATILINDKIVSEIQPFLLYRNVIYMQIKERFCQNEFGWLCKFDNKKGLVIESPNQRLKKETLKGIAGDSILIIDDYCYYGGEKGAIYQSPIDNLKKRKKVYQLPLWSYGHNYEYVSYSLEKKNEEAWIDYHQGGAVMGTDYHVKLKADGTYEEDTFYGFIKSFGDITVEIFQGPNQGNNLLIKHKDEEYKTIGNPNYLYGSSYVGDFVYLINDTIYLIGAEIEKNKDWRGICSVNINTGETTKVSELEVGLFTISGDYIYTISKGQIYKISLINGKEELLKSKIAVEDGFELQVLGKNIYYVNNPDENIYDDENLYKIGSLEPLNEGCIVTATKIEEEYLITTFKEENTNPYRIIIFDKNGKIVFKTSDIADINAITIEKGVLRYVETITNNMYSINLSQWLFI